MVGLFEGARRNKGYVFKSIGLAIIFWLLQFAFQFFVLIPGETVGSIVRSTALTGAILIAWALITGPLARLFPSKNYIYHRRTLGVLGFTFAILHMLAVMIFFFNFNFANLFFELNPYENALLFGLFAFILYIPLYVTSTDWAVQKIGFRSWKAVHRIVYIVFILTVLHFIQINPDLLFNPVGYLLLLSTSLVFILEIGAFIKHTKTRPGKGRYIGISIILIGFVLLTLGYILNNNLLILYLLVSVPVGLVLLYIIHKISQKRKEELMKAEQLKQKMIHDE